MPGIQSWMQPQEDPVTRLRRVLGDPFVDWILADPIQPLTAGQTEVVAVLDQLLVSAPHDSPDAFASVLGSQLTYHVPELGTSFGNALRMRSGGVVPDPPDLADDVGSALAQLVVEGYSGLLLPTDAFSFVSLSSFRSPSGQAFRAAVRADPILQNLAAGESDDMASVETLRSTGHGSGVQLAMLDSLLINAAWRLAQQDATNPSPDDVIRRIPVVLDILRAGLAQNPTATCPAAASFTGVLLPPNGVISATWGRLRAIDDHEIPPHLDQRTETQIGERIITINDAGDIVLRRRRPVYGRRIPRAGRQPFAVSGAAEHSRA